MTKEHLTACEAAFKAATNSYQEADENDRVKETDELNKAAYRLKLAKNAYAKHSIIPIPNPIKIIAGFPGVGKSHYCQHTTGCYDTDSNSFHKYRFPANYLRHIVGNVQKNRYGIIFVSTHAEVLEGMTECGLEFTVVYPCMDIREEYFERYRQRNSPPALIEKISDNWNDWITALQASSYKKCRLTSGQFLADVMEEL